MLTRCPSCHDELPPRARFCIECGHAVAATGNTERIAATGATERLGETIMKQPISSDGLEALCQRAFESGIERIVVAIHHEDTVAVFGLAEFIDVPLYRLDRATRDEFFSDRFLGVYRTAEIWVKPWAIRGYACMQEVR